MKSCVCSHCSGGSQAATRLQRSQEPPPPLDNSQDVEEEVETKRGRLKVRGAADNAGLCLLESVFIPAPACKMFAVLGLDKITRAAPATDGSHRARKAPQATKRCQLRTHLDLTEKKNTPDCFAASC